MHEEPLGQRKTEQDIKAIKITKIAANLEKLFLDFWFKLWWLFREIF